MTMLSGFFLYESLMSFLILSEHDDSPISWTNITKSSILGSELISTIDLETQSSLTESASVLLLMFYTFSFRTTLLVNWVTSTYRKSNFVLLSHENIIFYIKIEEIFPYCPDYPNGQKLQIHDEKLIEDPSVYYSVPW